MRIILILCLALFTNLLNAQFEFGIKGGLNSIDLITDGIQINNGSQVIDIDFKNSDYGHHLGLYTRAKFLGIYVEPAAIFNSNKVSYSITDYSENGPLNEIVSEKYFKLDIPVMVGIKAGFFRLFGGPVAHLHIASTSDLIKIKNYNQKFKDATYGYQAGFGFDIWKLRFEMAYEGNLSSFGDHINIDGHNYSFGQSASRVIGSVGYKF